MPREPDPMRECRPGGTCPQCNPRPVYCPGCEVEVDEPGYCDTCSEEDERHIQADAANALAEGR